ncbi:DUF2975 domain-containing protein [Streptomyces sp. NPDC058409]|uniref:DUF2975 domain-containing protein n=1 Tax=Streptomyces sp. NPDC058409 TaxID=3346484 RepID=UPI00364A4379
MTQDSKLLEPLSTVVSGVVRLLIGLLAVWFVLSWFNPHIHFGWAMGGTTCVTADWISGSSSDTDMVYNAAAGAHVNAIPQYCTAHPGTYQGLLKLLGELPAFILLLGGLLMLNSLLRAAAREGVYTPRTAADLRLLGWWLLLGSLAVETIEAIAKAALLATLAEEAPFSAGAWLNTWTSPYLAILTALGLLTFARIMRAGVAMREDLDAVV